MGSRNMGENKTKQNKQHDKTEIKEKKKKNINA